MLFQPLIRSVNTSGEAVVQAGLYHETSISAAIKREAELGRCLRVMKKIAALLRTPGQSVISSKFAIFITHGIIYNLKICVLRIITFSGDTDGCFFNNNNNKLYYCSYYC
jgi:hypothetical protein